MNYRSDLLIEELVEASKTLNNKIYSNDISLFDKTKTTIKKYTSKNYDFTFYSIVFGEQNINFFCDPVMESTANFRCLSFFIEDLLNKRLISTSDICITRYIDEYNEHWIELYNLYNKNIILWDRTQQGELEVDELPDITELTNDYIKDKVNCELDYTLEIRYTNTNQCFFRVIKDDKKKEIFPFTTNIAELIQILKNI